jgi:PPOX class probable F420-dependent enzyme
MSVPRARADMAPEDIMPFINEQRDLQVASIGRDGTPHLATMWFAVIDGQICFGSFTKSQKIRNLRRNPRLACLVSSGSVYRELRGVSITGTARIVDDREQVARHSLTISRRNQPSEPLEALAAAAQSTAARRSLVFVEPVRIASWDHTRLSP